MTRVITAEKTVASSSDAEFHWLKEAEYVAKHTAEEEIIVDIAAVNKISSHGLNELIRLHLQVKQDGRRLVLENAQRQIWEIVTLTRLNRLIEFRDPVSKGS